MAAGRAAGDGKEARVAAEALDVRLRPRHRAQHVDDLIGPRRSWAQPVRDRHAHPAVFGEDAHERRGLAPLVAGCPRPAVHLHQHGRAGVGRQVGSAPHIEPVALARVAIGDVAAVADHVAAVGEWHGAVPPSPLWPAPATARCGLGRRCPARRRVPLRGRGPPACRDASGEGRRRSTPRSLRPAPCPTWSSGVRTGPRGRAPQPASRPVRGAARCRAARRRRTGAVRPRCERTAGARWPLRPHRRRWRGDTWNVAPVESGARLVSSSRRGTHS